MEFDCVKDNVIDLIFNLILRPTYIGRRLNPFDPTLIDNPDAIQKVYANESFKRIEPVVIFVMRCLAAFPRLQRFTCQVPECSTIHESRGSWHIL